MTQTNDEQDEQAEDAPMRRTRQQMGPASEAEVERLKLLEELGRDAWRKMRRQDEQSGDGDGDDGQEDDS